MSRPLMAGASMQPFVPKFGSHRGVPTTDPITRYLYKIGQVGPRAEQRWFMSHGRHLAGLGGLNETQAPWDTDYKDGFVGELEREDDVYGSGIFDTYGRSGTVHPDMGVFADHPSLPGYIDREVQYSVSKDIYDITSGADVVTVAGGGMTYQERGGLPYPFQGRAACPPPRALPPPTDLTQVYVSLVPQSFRGFGGPAGGGRPKPVCCPPPSPTHAPPPGCVPCSTPRRCPPPSPTHAPPPGCAGFGDVQLARFQPLPAAYNPPPGPKMLVPMAVPGRGTQMRVLPEHPSSTRLPIREIDPYATSGGATPQPIPGTPFSRVPYQTRYKPVRRQQIVNTGVAPAEVTAAIRAMGATDSGAPGWGTYAFAGLLVGGAAALFYGTTKIGKGR